MEDDHKAILKAHEVWIRGGGGAIRGFGGVEGDAMFGTCL